MSGVGRPSRPNPETLERGRRYLELIDVYGVTAEAIAAREGVARSDVYRARQLARMESGDAAPTPPRAQRQQPANLRKMPAGTLLHRAWIAMRDVRAFELLGAEGREFWVNALMEIRGASDDGVALTFGPGEMYQSQPEFVTVFRATPAELENLFARGLLVNLDGNGVAIPFRFGLRREPTREPAVAPAHAGRGTFEVVEGGLSESEETRVYSDSESENIRIYSDSPGGVSSDSAAIYSDSARAAFATATAKDSKDSKPLSSSSSNLCRAGESELIRTESEETPPGESEKTPLAVSPLAVLAGELAVLAKLERAPNADDLASVQTWSDAGDTPEQMRAVIAVKMGQRAGKPSPAAMGYFTGAMKDARVRRRLPAATAALPASANTAAPVQALSPEDQALMDRVRAVKHDHPPLLADFRPDSKTATPARRWLDAAETWAKRGWHRAFKPPDFTLLSVDRATFDDEMDAVEEEALTAPDQPGAG